MKRLAIIILLIFVPLSFVYAQDIQKVEIIVDSYSFRSIASTVPHDFTIDYPEADLTITHDVRGGRDASFTFTPNTPGTYKFYCSKSGLFGASHEERGMVGTLIVE